MTRKSKREIENQLDEMASKDTDEPLTVVIRRDRVTTEGEFVETVTHREIEL